MVVKTLNMKQLFFLYVILLSSFNTIAQIRRCRFDELHKERIQQHPEFYRKSIENEIKIQQNIFNQMYKRKEILIPVVVHVLYNTDLENISDEQINSQIDVLNQDYNKLNSDTLLKTHPFYSQVGSIDIKFHLATIDPSNNSTNGITRTKTSKVSWSESDISNDNMKFSSSGGIDNWNPKKYLNIYVVRFDTAAALLGYAYPPEDLANFPETDGVVIDFRAFGTIGTAGIEGYDAYKLGRTTTHEVGHWLDLIHIWGDKVLATDKVCGDDKVSDTPPAEGNNSGNPTFPWRPNNKCGSGVNGEMYMNYMDYVHDKSMKMFTKGQTSRMNAAVSLYRSEILNNADVKVTSIGINSSNNNYEIKSPTTILNLSVSILPIEATNKSVKWSVMPDSVASIDQTGKLTVKKNGKVEVSVATLDGSLLSDKKTITISGFDTVKVSKIDIISDSNNFTINAPNTQLFLKAAVYPINATYPKVKWSIFPDTVATIDSLGRVIALKNGSVIVTAFALDGSGVFTSDTINIIGFDKLKVTNNDYLKHIEFYPNPVIDILHIELLNQANFDMSVKDMLGNIRMKNSFVKTQYIALDVNSLSSGCYYLEFIINGNTLNRKFIKY